MSTRDPATPERPDYVVCVATGMQGEKRTWCGRYMSGQFTFVDAGHAALAARENSRLLVCPECSAAIIKILQKGTWQQ